MSTEPNGWQAPKTNWKAADVVLPGDLNRIEGNTNAIESGSRTLDPSQVPSGNTGSLRQLLDWFANRLKAITGKQNWYDAPDFSLADAASKAYVDSLRAHVVSAFQGTTTKPIVQNWTDSDVAAEITTSGGTVLVNAHVTDVWHGSSSAPKWFDVRVIRDDDVTVVAGRAHCGQNHNGAIHLMGVDTPSAGIHTYKIQWRALEAIDVGGQFSTSRGIVLVELHTSNH